MKNLYLTAFLALLLSSCSKETGFDVSESGEVVKFTSSISGVDDGIQTRAEGDLTHFPELEEGNGNYIIIYMDIDGGDAGTKCTMGSTSDGGLFLRDNAVYHFPENGGSVSFYSVWPNETDPFGSTGAVYPTKNKLYQLAANADREYIQTGKNKDLSTNDVMIAVNSGVTTNPVELKYCHLMSNISVALKKGLGEWGSDELEKAIVRVHVPRAKLEVNYQNLKTWVTGKDLSIVTDWSGFLKLGGWSDANYIFKIDTYVCNEFGNYGEYARAFVGSMYKITASNQQYAYIEILRNSEDQNPLKVNIPVGTDFQPNKRYIFDITVNKGTSTRSNEIVSYYIGSSKMIIKDYSTGESD